MSQPTKESGHSPPIWYRNHLLQVKQSCGTLPVRLQDALSMRFALPCVIDVLLGWAFTCSVGFERHVIDDGPLHGTQ